MDSSRIQETYRDTCTSLTGVVALPVGNSAG
jgi:hypothetical protein